jgi:hypothetical protein
MEVIMTVLACDGDTVAADSMSTADEQKYRSLKPKLIRKKGVLFGFFGAESGRHVLVEWYLSGADPGELPVGLGGGWHMVVFHPKKAVVYHKELLYGDEYEYPCAFGSGGQFAQGALSAGASSVEAAKIACKHCTSCGGPVITKRLVE